MPEKVNETDIGMIEFRRRNLKAAELLEQWMVEDAGKFGMSIPNQKR